MTASADEPTAPPAQRSIRSLLAAYADALAELKARGIVRTANQPVADYAEHLVRRALGGELAPNSERSWDIRLADGTRIQVKARRLSNPPVPGDLQLSVVRTWSFDQLAVVLLKHDFSIHRAALVPMEGARAAAAYRQHVNGSVLIARESLLTAPGSQDITATVAAAAASIDA